MFRGEIPKWARRFLEAADEIRGRITSYVEFKRRLEQLLAECDCPIRRIQAACIHGGREIVAVDVGEDAPSFTKRCLDQPIGPDSPAVMFKGDYWVASSGAVRIDHLKPVQVFFEAYLAIDGRREGLLILDAKRPVVLNALKATIEAYTPRADTQGLALAFIDLDNFKTVNDTVGHATGDEVLRDIERHMMEISRSVDLVGFSKGGDEYVLLFPDADDFLVLSTINSLRHRIREHTYGPANLQVDFTAGVARPKSDLAPNLDDLLRRSEDVTKEPGQTEGTKAGKKRKTISFDGGLCASNAPIEGVTFAQLGTAMIRAGYQHPKPFSNQALNFISHEVFAVLTSEKKAVTEQHNSIKRVVDELLSWLGAKLNETTEEHHLIGSPCFAASLPSLAVALGIVHGIVRASASEPSIVPSDDLSLELQLPVAIPPHSCLRDTSSGTVLWGQVADSAQWVKVGSRITAEKNEASFLPLAIVLEIGLAHKLVTASGDAIPQGLFGGIVVVDDRPKTGGGLPDFWQAAIANLAAQRLLNIQTVRRIIVLGDTTSAPETINRLTGNKKVKAEELGELANCPADAINDFLGWAKTSIVYASNISDVITALYDSALELNVVPVTQPEASRARSTSIKRPSSKDLFILPTTEGLRCKTPIDAYPAVLDCLRHSDDTVLTWDDANQAMYEVIGFKLLVENSGGNAIPDYWHEEKKSLDDYAQNVLVGNDSLIGQCFYHDGQFEQFIKHLTGYFTQGKRNASTRRAILVVPNPVGNLEENNPKPRGLVSIWATPRHSGSQSELAFCFVWRTVEALVGFPYSFYGSVKFAEHVISTINERLANVPEQVSRVSLGSLRYLALSLHMRVDDYHRRFAKRIVDAASD